MKIYLYQLEKGLKNFLATLVFVLTIGVSIGLSYLKYTTHLSTTGTIERYNGTESEDEFELRESYPKQIAEMLQTTHTHVISFALIFGMIGIIFYFNSISSEFWRNVLILEPLISTLITFGSIWGIRYLDSRFVYITIISASFMYFSFYLMSGMVLYELLLKKKRWVGNN